MSLAIEERPRGETSNIFDAAVMPANDDIFAIVPRVERAPVSEIKTKEPGGYCEQKPFVDGGRAQTDHALRTAFSEREKAVGRHGLAEFQNNKLSNIVNVFNFISPEFLFLDMAFYALADRRSSKNRENEPGYHPVLRSEKFRQNLWNRGPGYHSTKATQQEIKKGQEEKYVLLIMPFQDVPAVRRLFGQRANLEKANDNLVIREQNGLPGRAGNVVESGLKKGDIDWALLNRPAPAYL